MSCVKRLALVVLGTAFLANLGTAQTVTKHPASELVFREQLSLQSRAWQVLEEGVSDKKVVNRLLAARPDKETIDALKTALQDKDWAVRAAAAKGLGRLGRPELGSFLTSSLEDGKPSVRFAAAVAVLRLDTGKAAAARYAQVR